MPYDSIDDLPESVRSAMSDACARVFRESYNDIEDRNDDLDEEDIIQRAYGAVREVCSRESEDDEYTRDEGGEQAGAAGGMDLPDAPHEQLQSGSAIAEAIDDGDDEQPTVRVVPIGEGDTTKGVSGEPTHWGREALRDAVESGALDGAKIIKGQPGGHKDTVAEQVAPEDIIGRVDEWSYEEGVGPVGESPIVDEQMASRIEHGLLDVSPDLYRRLDDFDESLGAKPVTEILSMPYITVLDRGSSPSASIEPATAEALGYNPDTADPQPAWLSLKAGDETEEQLALYPMQFFGHGEFVGEEFVDDAVNALDDIPGVSAVASESTDHPELVTVIDPDAANLDGMNEAIESALEETPFEPIGDFDWLERVAGEMLAGSIGNRTIGAATGSDDSDPESPVDPSNPDTTMSDEDLQEQLANVRAERNTLEDEKEDLSDDLKSLRDEKESLEEQLASLEDEKEAKQSALSDLKEEIGPWKEMLSRIAADDSMLDPEQVAETQSFEQLSEQVISTLTEDVDDDDSSPMELVEEQLSGTVDPRGDGPPDESSPDNLTEEQLAEANSHAREVMGADDVMAAAEEQLSARDYAAQAFGVDPAECDSASEYRRKVESVGGD